VGTFEEYTMIIHPYLSIDIETTGLDCEKDRILEIGAIYDDGITPIEKLHTFRKIVQIDRLSGNPYALSLNRDLLLEISKNTGELKLVHSFNMWLSDLFYNSPLEGKPITLAGKNVGNFDLKFLIKEGFNYPYNHRIIDLGSMYLTDFGYIPSLNTINKSLNYKPVAHRALDDAMNVVKAIRHKYNCLN
jgi:oligoribonuclease (3'-5' exoribonuclease)